MTSWPALLLIVMGGALLMLSRLLGRRSRLPSGTVIWDDGPRRGDLPEPLYDPELNLVGRPDYLLRHRANLIPVEVKARQAPPQPYRGHVLQAAAYCRLVEKVLGQRPEMAVLKYANKSFEIRYSRALESDLVNTVRQLHSLQGALPDRSHENRARCAACGHFAMCDQALT